MPNSSPDIPSAEIKRANRLSDLMHLNEYIQERRHIFPSVESLRWFIRRNRMELIKRGAICAPTGCVMVDALEMDCVVIEIGRERVSV